MNVLSDKAQKIFKAQKDFREWVLLNPLPDGLTPDPDMTLASWPNSLSMVQNGARVVVPINWDGTSITLGS